MESDLEEERQRIEEQEIGEGSLYLSDSENYIFGQFVEERVDCSFDEDMDRINSLSSQRDLGDEFQNEIGVYNDNSTASNINPEIINIEDVYAGIRTNKEHSESNVNLMEVLSETSHSDASQATTAISSPSNSNSSSPTSNKRNHPAPPINTSINNNNNNKYPKNRRLSRKWTTEEDNLLRKGYKSCKGKIPFWVNVTKIVRTRTGTQCKSHYQKFKNEGEFVERKISIDEIDKAKKFLLKEKQEISNTGLKIEYLQNIPNSHLLTNNNMLKVIDFIVEYSESQKENQMNLNLNKKRKLEE